MRKVKDNVIKIKEEIKIGDVILEAGDKIRVVETKLIPFESYSVSGYLDLRNKTLEITIEDGSAQEISYLANHSNDPILNDVYEALIDIGYGDIEIDERKDGTIIDDTVTLYLK